jgi:CHAT domain-containing protein
MGEATAALEQAATLALADEDWSTLSYARGLLGQVLELQGQWPAAEAKTGEALFLAQRAGNQRALFEWQWQSARVLLAQGRLESAKHIYRLATDTFRTIRGTLRGGRRSLLDYQSNPGDAFFELANLNFRLADDAKAPEQSTALLRQARDAVEAYKSFEVESQFLSAECSALLENLSGNIEQVLEAGGKDAAILYVLPLEQRTELLVTLPGQKQERRSLAKGRKELEAVANRLRSGLAANRQRAEVQQAAESLYTDLIRPLEALFTENQIKQLVFVLDGALARVPMAALYDGEAFLIEKYAVANSPGLALMEPGRARAGKPTILLGALTTEEAGFVRLKFAQQEVEEIGREFRNVTLAGDQFSADNLRQALAAQPFNLVHLASHASFGGSAETTFVVVHGQRINLNELAELVRPTLLREQPIELLAFSACESARGNERLELGLAGVALKSGARSVLATLWEVEDRSIARLMSEFYRQLAANPALTKAQALRAAQLSLLRDGNFSAPYFWAPAVLVGNWL